MPDEVRDRRSRGWSWFDNRIIDHFGPVIGPYGIALYMVLVRHSDATTQQCFPSQSTLAKSLHISKQTVWRTMQKLVDVGLITRRQRKSTSGDFDSTIYTLVDTWAGVVPVGNNPAETEVCVNIQETEEVVPVGNNVIPQGNEGCSCGEQGVVPVGNTNKTYLEQDLKNKEQTLLSDAPASDVSVSSSPADVLATSPPPKRLTVFDIINAWNEICAGHGRLPRKLRPTDKLKGQIRCRLKEQSDEEFWNTVLNKCVDVPFLNGSKTDWHATLDWLVENSSNAIKVYEGNYERNGDATR